MSGVRQLGYTIGEEGLFRLGLRELWAYRELFYFFAWRDIKIRYKEAVLGVTWAVIQPLLMMAIVTIFFGRLLRVPSDGIPYPLFAYSGLLVWTFFAGAVNGATTSMVSSAPIIKKIYFPRIIIPISATLVSLFDWVMALGPFLLLTLAYGIAIRPVEWLAALTAGLVVAGLTATGIGSFFASMSVLFRDFRYVLPFSIQIGFFLTPVIFPPSIVPEKARLLLALNPMAGAIALTRTGLGAPSPSPTELTLSVGMALILCVGGTAVFRLTERHFADRS
jgi:lipopolysaccharide transport system permease protein